MVAGTQLAVRPPALEARLRLASSNAIALIESSAPDREVKASLSPAERDLLPVAIVDVEQALRPFDQDCPHEDAEMVAELTASIVAMQPGLSEEAKAEWISVVQRDLARLPFGLVMEAIVATRSRCRFPGDFLPAVTDHVGPRKRRLELELENYLAIQAADQ